MYNQRLKMRIIFRTLRCLVILSMALLLAYCDEESPTQSLPQACEAQGVHAIAVLDKNLTCIPTNAFQDGEEVLGPPDFSAGDGKLELDGILSLGLEGTITLYMGSCIQDLAGPDIRVYQAVSTEAVAVSVSQNEDGPFVNIGESICNGSCDFDLAGSGLSNIRVVRIQDRERIQFTDATCDNAGPSPGADIDAVEVLH
jgi:hypothetical protein